MGKSGSLRQGRGTLEDPWALDPAVGSARRRVYRPARPPRGRERSFTAGWKRLRAASPRGSRPCREGVPDGRGEADAGHLTLSRERSREDPRLQDLHPIVTIGFRPDQRARRDGARSLRQGRDTAKKTRGSRPCRDASIRKGIARDRGRSTLPPGIDPIVETSPKSDRPGPTAGSKASAVTRPRLTLP